MPNGASVLTDPAKLQWLFDIGNPLLCLGLALYFVRQCVTQRQLTRSALIFFAGLTVSWQEFFGAWGSYLVFNPHFALIPWGSTLWTTPYKPWGVITAYGWFFTLGFLAFFWVMDRVRARRPNLNPWVACVVVGIPVFYLIMFLVDTGAIALGMWSYTAPIGPTLRITDVEYSLVYPVLNAAAWLALMGTLLYWRDANGDTMFDRLVGTRRWAARLIGTFGTESRHNVMSGGHAATIKVVEEKRLSVAAQAVRLIAWIIGFNLSYWFLATLPVILIRIFAIAEPSSLIP